MTIKMSNLGGGLHSYTDGPHTFYVKRQGTQYSVFHTGPRPDMKARKKKGHDKFAKLGTLKSMKLAKVNVATALTMLNGYDQAA